MTTLLDAINAPAAPTEPQPLVGFCSGTPLSALCGRTFSSCAVRDGCATTHESCMPAAFLQSDTACRAKNSAGAYVISQGTQLSEADASAEAEGDEDEAGAAGGSIGVQTVSRPRKAKQATWEGCCVTAATQKKLDAGKRVSSTCKRIRVGKQWRAGGSRSLQTTMNPLAQVNNCMCFNVREYVKGDMYTKENRRAPQHYPANFPFTTAVVAKACIARKSGRGCTKRWIHTGSATFTCLQGRNGEAGTLRANFTDVPGVALLGARNVVASCETSRLSQPSSCRLDNAGSMVRTATATSVSLKMADWGPNCLCRGTGRRPTIKVDVPDAVVGKACPGGA